MGYDTDKMTLFGCPSLFLNPDKLLAEKINEKLNLVKLNAERKTAFYPSYFSARELSDTYQLSQVGEKNNFMVVQSSVLISMIANFRNTNKVVFSDNSKHLKNYINESNMKRIIYIEDIYEQSKFLNENIDFTYGTRIHGAVLSLMSEVPTLLVHWDDRTRELGGEMCIPSISQDRFKEILDQGIVNNLIDFVKLDIEKFNSNRKRKANL